jgi:hypothetical protein
LPSVHGVLPEPVHNSDPGKLSHKLPLRLFLTE